MRNNIDKNMIKERNREYYLKHKEKIKLHTKLYKENHKEHCKIYNKNYRVNHHTLNPDGFEDVASNDERKATVHYDKLGKRI